MLLRRTGMRIIASGGISSLADIYRLKLLEDKGLSGIIIGKALYEGRFTLTQALKLDMVEKKNRERRGEDMRRKTILVWVLAFFMFLFSGCATGRRQKDLEIQGLRNQLSVLEAQLKAKDEEIAALRESINKIRQEKEAGAAKAGRKKVIPEVKSRPNIRQIQTALKNAGYNPGAIDGRMGRQTRDAIRAFQRVNNLVVDGRVGKKTWSLLKGYLYKRVK